MVITRFCRYMGYVASRRFCCKSSFVANTMRCEINDDLGSFCLDFYSDIDDFTPDFVQISALVISDWDTRKDLRGQKKL